MAFFVFEAAGAPGLHTRAAAALAQALNTPQRRTARLVVPHDPAVRFDVHALQHATADGRLVETFRLWGDRAGLAVETTEPWSSDLLALPGTAVVAVDPALFAEGRELRRPAVSTGHSWVDVAPDGRLIVDGPDAAELDVHGPIAVDPFGRAGPHVRPGGGARPQVTIAVVGDRDRLHRVYAAVLAALGDAADRAAVDVTVDVVSSGDVREAPADVLAQAQGLVLPGGADLDEVPGQVAAAIAALNGGIPTLGLCLGMQSMALAVARTRAGLPEAELEEAAPDAPIKLFERLVDPSGRPQHRMGDRTVVVRPGSRLHGILHACGRDPSSLVERTNHRYGLAPRYRRDLTHAGLSVTAEDAEAQVAYVLEAPTAKLFLGFQGHPELQSTPAHPHPGFVALLRTAARLPG